jgi:hypothetical protein
MEELYNMPVADRKNYILIHNKETEKEIERMKKKSK